MDAYTKMLEQRNRILVDVLKMVRKDSEYIFLNENTRKEIDFAITH